MYGFAWYELITVDFKRDKIVRRKKAIKFGKIKKETDVSRKVCVEIIFLIRMLNYVYFSFTQSNRSRGAKIKVIEN